ncbi:MAG: DUF1971 domain-containing protein [Novosphingobium sp.]|jgi:tellurite resistance-related uncharacterized protein|nr:DUF1971 domain-containing protein [Novosphingobium sp.]
MEPKPYKATPIFDADSLPAAIRSAHNTKQGVWGLLRVIEGVVDLVFHDPPAVIRVTPDHPASIPPEAVHHVEPAGPMRMQVEFYRELPLPHS